MSSASSLFPVDVDDGVGISVLAAVGECSSTLRHRRPLSTPALQHSAAAAVGGNSTANWGTRLEERA